MEEETTNKEDHFPRCTHSNERRFINLLILGIITGMGLAAVMLAAVAIIVRITGQPDYPAEQAKADAYFQEHLGWLVDVPTLRQYLTPQVFRCRVAQLFPKAPGWEIKLDESCPGFSTAGRPAWFTTLGQEAVPVKWPDVDSVSWFEEGDRATIMDRLQHIFYECIYFYKR